MPELIEHSGIVERTGSDKVFVRITSRSACGSCKAREACGLAEAAEKIIEVTTPDAAAYTAGDSVLVGVHRNAGMWSVALAYGGALVVLLAALILAIEVLRLGEGAAVAVSLTSVVLYYGVLWLFRRKIEHTIQFTITKN